jgi:hypothetical protein
MGVRSKSKAKPIKEREFPLAVRHFEGRKSYHDWMFQHPNPSSLSPLASPMGMGAAPGWASMQPPALQMPVSGQAPPQSPPQPLTDVRPMSTPPSP